MNAAASSSAVPPISPTRAIFFGARSSWDFRSYSPIFVSLFGCPPIPMPVLGQRPASDLLAALARRDAGDDLGPEVEHRSRVELTLVAGDPLDDHTALLRQEHGHLRMLLVSP